MIKTYKLRTIIIFLFFCSLFGLALFYLFSLQIKQHEFFINRAQKQYFVTVTQLPPRASIIDRNNQPLALNKESLAAFILPRTIKDSKKLKRFLQKHFPTCLKQWNRKPKAHFLYVKRRLTDAEQELIQASNIEGLHILSEPSRFYPNNAAGSLTGITNIDNSGLFGIELYYDKQLAGTPNTNRLEKDARSGTFYFAKETTQEGSAGTSIKLTIDNDLQFLVHEELLARIEQYKAKEGAVVVLDPLTGDILAMASYPYFDPNNTTSISQIATKNTALTESYEFGSAIKAFTALAALEEKIVTPDEQIYCENSKTAIVEGRKINNWEAQGWLSFQDVITRSNNFGIAKVAKRLDKKLYDHFKKLGFGKKTGIPFPGEQSGYINPPQNWSKQSIISLSYGYELTTTLLQITNAFSVFANNGYLMKPRLVINDQTSHYEPKKIYSDESIALMRDILQKTTMKGGTAKYAAIEGYTTMGKTSTANLLVNGLYDETKNLYGFVGIVEKGNHKRVIGCFLKESPQRNLFSSTVAAPLFKKIAEKSLIHNNVIARKDNEPNNSSNRTT
ncbi:penicillin-binding protein 2 [Candidatus Babeliales bacterium]|nr:penicillin-binding protein 2 [Candidatus Babeliales bacterium]